MIDALTLAVLGLAGWRVAYMLTNEAGPGNLFGKLRRMADSGEIEIKQGSLQQLTVCVYCMAFWTTAAAALIWAVDIKAARDAIFVVAAWGAATALDMVARKD